MENQRDVIALLDILYAMVNEAWSMPMGNGKCIIEKDKAVEIINEIKQKLPSTIAEANRLVSARDEFIGNAKREAEGMRKSAEERARAMVQEQEIVRTAKLESQAITDKANKDAENLYRMASQYVNQMMDDAASKLQETMATVNGIQQVHNEALANANNQLKGAMSMLKTTRGAFNKEMTQYVNQKEDEEEAEATQKAVREEKVSHASSIARDAFDED